MGAWGPQRLRDGQTLQMHPSRCARSPPSALSRTLPNPAPLTGLPGETLLHPHRLQVTGEPGPKPGCRRQTLYDQAGGRSHSWQRPRPPRGTVCPGSSALPQAAPWSQEGGAAQASWLLPRPLSRPRKAFWWGQEAAQAQCWLITGRRLGSPRPPRVGLSSDLTRLGLRLQADEGSDSGWWVQSGPASRRR